MVWSVAGWWRSTQLSGIRKVREGEKAGIKWKRKSTFSLFFYKHVDESNISDCLNLWRTMWLNGLAGSGRRSTRGESRLVLTMRENFFGGKWNRKFTAMRIDWVIPLKWLFKRGLCPVAPAFNLFPTQRFFLLFYSYRYPRMCPCVCVSLILFVKLLFRQNIDKQSDITKLQEPPPNDVRLFAVQNGCFLLMTCKKKSVNFNQLLSV